MEPGSVLISSENTLDEPVLTDVPYRQLVGALLWASLGTRPDISFAVNILSQFVDKPSASHWEAAKRVLR